MWIMDFGNDDNFGTSWLSNPEIKKVTDEKTERVKILRFER